MHILDSVACRHKNEDQQQVMILPTFLYIVYGKTGRTFFLSACSGDRHDRIERNFFLDNL